MNCPPEAANRRTTKSSLFLMLVVASCAFAQNAPIAVVQTATDAQTVAFSPDGKLVATLDHFARDLSVWEVDSGRKLASLHRTNVPIINPPPSPGQSYTTGTAAPSDGDLIAFAPDGQHVAAFRQAPDPNSPPVVWDTITGKALAPWKRSAGGALTLANTSWTPDQIRSWRVGPTPASTLAQAIAVSRDGALATTLTDTKDAVNVWQLRPMLNVINTQEIGSIPVAGKSNANLQEFSPDGRFLAIGIGDGVEIWSVNPFAKVVTLMPDLWLYGIQFSPDGKLLAARGVTEFRVLKVGNWEEVLHYAKSSDSPHTFSDMQFSSDSRKFAVADGKLHVWDLQTRAHHESFGLPSDAIIQAVATTADGSAMASARGPLQPGEFAKHDSSLELWPLSAPEAPRLLAQDLYTVSELTFSHDSQWLAAATITNDIAGRITQILTGDARLWHVNDGKERSLDSPASNGDEWSATRVSFSPDDKQVVASVLLEGKQSMRDCEAGQPCDAETVLYDVRTTFLDIASGRAMNSTPLSKVETSDANNPDGAKLVWLSPDGRRAVRPGKPLDYVDTLNGRRLTSFRPPQDAPQPGACTGPSDCDVGLRAFGFVAFRADMKQIAVSDGSAVVILDSKTGAIVSGPAQLDDSPADSSSGLTAAFSPDGKLLAVLTCSSGTGSGQVRLYDSSTLRLRSTIQLDRAASSLAFTANGALLVTGDYDGLLRLWNTNDRSLAATLVRAGDEWMVFAPNGLFDSSEKGASLLAWRSHGHLVSASAIPEMKTPGLLAQIVAGQHTAPRTTLQNALDRALASQ